MIRHELKADDEGCRLAGEAAEGETARDTELSEDDLDQVAGGDWAPTPPTSSTTSSGSGGGP